jgi:hypothetical protein
MKGPACGWVCLAFLIAVVATTAGCGTPQPGQPVAGQTIDGGSCPRSAEELAVQQKAAPGMLDQSRISADVPVVRRYGRDHADSFADLFATPSGFLCVGFTRDGAAHLEALGGLVPYPDILRLFPARYTEAELSTVKDELSNRLFSYQRDMGTTIASVGIDVVANVVEVTALDVTERGTQVLRDRFGDRVRLVKGQPAHLT